jgi:hypothetical protein
MRKILLFLFFCDSLAVLAQKADSRFYLTYSNGDTLVCNGIHFETSPKFALITLTYTTSSGEIVKLKDRKSIPKTLSGFKTDFWYYDMMPKNIKKPDGKKVVGKRHVDGKLKLSKCYHFQTHTFTDKTSMGGSIQRSQTKATTYVHLIMPDGSRIDVNNKTIKYAILPYLRQCEQYNSDYPKDIKLKKNMMTREFEYDAFINMIRNYNLHCK